MRARLTLVLVAALAAACSTVAVPAQAREACARPGYAYAGLQPARTAHGIAADLRALAAPAVERGHVAGWIGVGGPGEGPQGADEWIQVGLSGVPAQGSTLYYEVRQPGAQPAYTELAADVPTGQPVRLAVLEVASSPGSWRVWVNGEPVTPPIWLPAPKGLTPMAMGESWAGGQRACNRYSYRFTNLAIAAARGGPWQAARAAFVFQDPGYRVIRHAPASFDATVS